MPRLSHSLEPTIQQLSSFPKSFKTSCAFRAMTTAPTQHMRGTERRPIPADQMAPAHQIGGRSVVVPLDADLRVRPLQRRGIRHERVVQAREAQGLEEGRSLDFVFRSFSRCWGGGGLGLEGKEVRV